MFCTALHSTILYYSVVQALNYPVDLYYLMDLSNSMTDDRDNVVKVINICNAILLTL